jgi:pimeloyl-ACP methyl ester carboxylesterase
MPLLAWPMLRQRNREVHLAIAEHFYLLAEDEIDLDPKRQPGDSAVEDQSARSPVCRRSGNAVGSMSVRLVSSATLRMATARHAWPRMLDYVMATTTTNILDWHCGFAFDPPLPAYAGITVPALILCGESGHPSIAKAAEILLGAMPRASFKTIPRASHFMMATHPADVAALVGRHVLEAEKDVGAAD